MSAAARNCPDSHCTLNLLMFQLFCHRFIPGYGLRKRPTTPDREIVTLGGMNRQTERRREGKLGVLFTPIKAPELMCNCRLCGSTLSLSASRVPSRGCRKMSRTRRSDPVCCWTEQNITSWLFLTSKQTFSGPLLPEKKKKKGKERKTLNNRGKNAISIFVSSWLEQQMGCSKMQKEKWLERILNQLFWLLRVFQNASENSCRRARNDTSPFLLYDQKHTRQIEREIHLNLSLLWQKPVASKRTHCPVWLSYICSCKRLRPECEWKMASRRFICMTLTIAQQLDTAENT